MDGHFPIGVVAKRSGLSPHVIRVWERRYGAITPARSATNRRLYSEADIRRLSSLARLTRYGHSIGQVATLSDAQLAELLRTIEPLSQPPRPSRRLSSELHPKDFVTEALGRIKAMDSRGLEVILNEAGIRMNQRDLIDYVLSPLLDQIGVLWENAQFRPAHEHMASAIIQSFISHLPEAYLSSETAPRIVIATLEGQRHELGALMAAKTAATEGWDVTYLGANLPTEDIVAVTKESDAHMLGISIIYAESSQQVLQAIDLLQKGLAPRVPIIVGGRFAISHRTALEKHGVIVVGTMSRFRELLMHRTLELTTAPS